MYSSDNPREGGSMPTSPSPSSTPNRSTDPRRKTRNARYYIEESLVVFKVEEELFRVHRHYFARESSVFQHMFSSPPTSEGPEGDDDLRPIELPGVTTAQFELLLDYFYEGNGFLDYLEALSIAPAAGTENAHASNSSPQGKELHQQIVKLLDLLFVADLYDIGSARRFAIKTIEEKCGQCPANEPALSTVEKIATANRYNITKWLLPAYLQLCQRSEGLTQDEAKQLGLETSVKVFIAREKSREKIWGARGVIHDNYVTHVQAAIQEVLNVAP